MSINRTATTASSSTIAPPKAASKPLSKPWAIGAITIGSGLELYDSIVYNFFATLIAPLYFAVHDPVGQLLLSFATFGIGYVARPVGGVIIGAYADRIGRKPAVLLTLWLMAFSGIIFVVTPTYAQIGIFAPILMVIGRLVQGFAIGGEMGPASAMLLEYANDKSRGFYISWQTCSQGLASVFGALVALVLTNVLTPSALSSWGWRIAFLIGLLVIPVCLVIRKRLDETLVIAPKVKSAKTNAGWQLARKHWRMLLAGLLLMIGLASSIHMIIFYLVNYSVIQLHIPLSQAIWAGVLSSAIFGALAPFSGWLSDRVGRRKVVWWSRLTLLILVYPAFSWLNNTPSLTHLLVVVGCLSVPLAMTAPATIVLFSEVLPQQLRATGLSVGYYGATVLFGSFSQFFSTLLIHYTGSPNSPAFYMIGCGLISLIGLAMVPETLGRRLT